MVNELAGDIIRFSNNTAGIEKILKGLIGVLLVPTTPVARYLHPISPRATKKIEAATKQVSISRKIVRFLWFLDNALKALEARKGSHQGPLKWLIIGKWSCMCVYALTEAFTILHHMEVLKLGKSWWANGISHKGHKIYFVAILFSVMASAYQLVDIGIAERQLRKERRKLKPHKEISSSYSDDSSLSSSESDKEKAEAIKRAQFQDQRYPSPTHSQASGSTAGSHANMTQAEQRLAYLAEMERKKLFIDAARTSGTTNEKAPETGPIVKSLLADVCDLAIPASKVGWYNNKEVVSMAYIANSLLAGSVIWGRVNAKTVPKPGKDKNGPIVMVKK